MRYQADDLTIEAQRDNDNLVVRWLGRSEGRDPSRTLAPLLEKVGAAFPSAAKIEFDFRALEYMNSSTIRPILKLVQTASAAAPAVRVVYDGTKNWQRLSFKAIGAVLGSLHNVELSA